MCMDFGEVVPSIPCADASIFIIWFDDDGLVIVEVVQC